MNIEKEKLKHSNSKFLSNAKFLKGKKKGAINKKEENEVNTFSMTSLKLKEIYSVLSSKGKDSSIIKMFIYSIIIFLLIIGTSILNILIYLYFKDNIHTFYILIEKSENLYQNLLLEITIVKEMLIAKSSYYNNTIINNKALYYQALSKMLYHYFSENTFIISNLTNNFNVLNKQDEETGIKMPLYKNMFSSNNNDIYYYAVNKMYSSQIKEYMKHRINWVFVSSNNLDKNITINFSWRYYSNKINYKKFQYNPELLNNNSCSLKKLRMVNLFERNYEVGNKKNMFLNLINYCDKQNINVFSIVPFTVIINNTPEVGYALEALKEIISFVSK